MKRGTRSRRRHGRRVRRGVRRGQDRLSPRPRTKPQASTATVHTAARPNGGKLNIVRLSTARPPEGSAGRARSRQERERTPRARPPAVPLTAAAEEHCGGRRRFVGVLSVGLFAGASRFLHRRFIVISVNTYPTKPDPGTGSGKGPGPPSGSPAAAPSAPLQAFAGAVLRAFLRRPGRGRSALAFLTIIPQRRDKALGGQVLLFARTQQS